MINIVQGEDRTIVLTFKKDGAPFDLSAATEIVARFPAANGGVIEKKKSDDEIVITDGPAGTAAVILDNVDTVALLAGEKQTFQVAVDFTDDKRIFQVKKILNVLRPL